MTLTPPLDGMVYEVIPNIDESVDYTEAQDRRLTDDISEATVITSRVAGQEAILEKVYPDSSAPVFVRRHKVILDIDLPAKLVPSSTEGHYHLYIDHEVDWEDYQELLGAMARCGIIQNGYHDASIARGHTAARLPWVRKASTEAQPTVQPDGRES